MKSGSSKTEQSSRKPLAYLVYIPLSSYLSADHDYMVFAELTDAESFAIREDVDPDEIVPLYAQ